MQIQEFRDGIFALRTRRFGTVAEIMIKKLYKFKDSRILNYDKLDPNSNRRIEIKFSTVMKANDATITDENVIEQCLKANVAHRAMNSTEISDFSFDCNIQQIKCDQFDILYYGLFFADKVQIFMMTADQVKNKENTKYSNKQHRNNEGEGQFHINNETYAYHKQNHLQHELSYSDLYKLLKA